jgi:hypothetical protein
MALSAGLPAVASAQPARAADGYVDILRPPDLAIAFLESGPLPLTREGHRWNGAGISVQTELAASGMPVRIEAPEAPLLLVSGVDALLELPEELAGFAHEFLRAYHGNFDAFVGKRLRVVWAMKIDLFVNRPGNRD